VKGISGRLQILATISTMRNLQSSEKRKTQNTPCIQVKMGYFSYKTLLTMHSLIRMLPNTQKTAD